MIVKRAINQIMNLGLITSAVLFMGASCEESENDLLQKSKCYSPTQNLDIAYDANSEGCACDATVDEDVCIERVALLCRDGYWQAVEDGPCEPVS